MVRDVKLSEAVRASVEGRTSARADIVFTIVSGNYAAQAKVLMESLARTNPSVVRVIVAADNQWQDEFAGHNVVFAEDTDAPWRAMAAYYDALEYNTAIKPACFRHLFGVSEDVGRVVYLDPDIVVLEPLTPVFEALDRADAVLTPHMTRPLGVDDLNPDDHAILRSGVFNLGFLGLRRSPDQAAFIDWWFERCRFDCRVAFEDGLFTDQRWVDLAPGFFENLAVLRHPGVNLGYWNLPARDLAFDGGRWTVDGLPLVFFHYSGFDPAIPGFLSKHQTRIAVAEGSPLAALLVHCADALKAAGHAVASRRPYRFGDLTPGRPFTGLMRRALLSAARRGYDPGQAETAGDLADWLDGPSPACAGSGWRATRLVERLLVETRDTAERFDLGAEEGRRAAFDFVQAVGVRKGLDAPGLAAFQALWRGDGIAPAGGRAGDDASGGWPRACLAFWETDAEFRALFPGRLKSERVEMLAWCLGPAALDGRFDPADLSDGTGLSDTEAVAAARLAVAFSARSMDPRFRRDDPLAQLLAARFGLAHRVRWPRDVVAALDAVLGPLDGGGPLSAPPVTRAIIASRPDLQKAFGAERRPFLRLINWFVRLGCVEYGCALAALPAATRNNIVVRLARIRASFR